MSSRCLAPARYRRCIAAIPCRSCDLALALHCTTHMCTSHHPRDIATVSWHCSRPPAVDVNIGTCLAFRPGEKVHAYARDAADVTDKLTEYCHAFADDFEGSQGRKPKVLWLTEVAAGSSDPSFVANFVDRLMAPNTGLANRRSGSAGGFGFVERISWFSEFNFGSFNLTASKNGPGYTPRTNEQWVSSLFDPFGGLSPIGAKFFAHCAPANPKQ